MRHQSARVRLCFSAIVAMIGGCERPPYCEDKAGICPPPDPVVLANEMHLSKSLWFASEQIGDPDPVYCFEPSQTLCMVNPTGDHAPFLVVSGNDGAHLLSAEAQYQEQGFIPMSDRESLTYYDAVGDGNIEILNVRYPLNEPAMTRLLSSSGSEIWSHLNGPPIVADVNGDNSLEFVFDDADGVQIIRHDGSALLELPVNGSANLGDFDGDGLYEIMIVEYLEQEDDGPSLKRATVWTLSGSMLADFSMRSYVVTPARRPGDAQDYAVNYECQLFDLSGTMIDQVEKNEMGGCALEYPDYRATEASSTCRARTAGAYFTKFEDYTYPSLDSITTSVRFSADRPPYMVRFDYSIESYPNYLSMCDSFVATRTIMRVYDSEETLVYHEVIASSSGRNSFVVLPAESANKEVLLLGDGPSVLIYQIP